MVTTAISRNTSAVGIGEFHTGGTMAATGGVGGTGSVAGERTLTSQTRSNVAVDGSDPAPNSISSTDVAMLIRDHEVDLQPCYDAARVSNPRLSGQVHLRFTIGRTGEVTDASVVGLPEAPEVASCMTDRLRQIRFPPPAFGSIPFVHTINLAPPAHPGHAPIPAPTLRPTPRP